MPFTKIIILYYDAFHKNRIFPVLRGKMVNCCEPDCTNYSAKTKDVSYHKRPQDSELQKAWVTGIRRENLPPVPQSRVCCGHFEKECFEIDFIEELMGVKRKRKLNPVTVPSIFNLKLIFNTPGVTPAESKWSKNAVHVSLHTRPKRERQQLLELGIRMFLTCYAFGCALS